MKIIKKHNKGNTGKVRIISGLYKGRQLLTPGGKTHPMGERERIALFNMISDSIPGAQVLDAFSGSGALGFEALSRGAESVVFIDNSKEAEDCIYDNMVLLGFCQFTEKNGKSERKLYRSGLVSEEEQLGEVKVIRKKVSQFNTNQKFDIIFADPPYDNFDISEIKSLVKYLKTGGIFVLSHPEDIKIDLPGLNLIRTRQYARAYISIFQG